MDCVGDDAHRNPAQPEIGAQLAQVVKELRTEYSNATVLCCERMAHEIAQHPQNMIGNLLHQSNQTSGTSHPLLAQL